MSRPGFDQGDNFIEDKMKIKHLGLLLVLLSVVTFSGCMESRHNVNNTTNVGAGIDAGTPAEQSGNHDSLPGYDHHSDSPQEDDTHHSDSGSTPNSEFYGTHDSGVSDSNSGFYGTHESGASDSNSGFYGDSDSGGSDSGGDGGDD
jgi:hypothetical protein